MNIRQHNSTIPGFTVRRSVALISAAILFSAPAQAEIEIGRLPSTVTGEGVIGAKPNVFLVIDNGMGMAKNPSIQGYPNPNWNLLQQTAAGLIAALPQLEGKVRIGYSTSLPGRDSIERLTVGQGSNKRGNFTCSAFKLNGNVTKLDAYIKSHSDKLKQIDLIKDLAKNKNYIFLKKENGQYEDVEDFVFQDKGSGYGEITPREFTGNYARYIYAWLGGMCPATTNEGSDSQRLTAPSVKGHPPYADLRNKDAYEQAAKTSGNTYSWPLRNWQANFSDSNARPIIDIHAQVLAEISDINFLSNITSCGQNGCKGKAGGTVLPKSYLDKDPLRLLPDRAPYLRDEGYGTWYDAYANSKEDGFPGVDPLPCRKNYEIIVAQGPYSVSEKLDANGDVGYFGIGKTGAGGTYSWRLPTSDNGKGITDSSFPKEELYTKPYQFFPRSGIEGSLPSLPTESSQPGRYLFGKTALQSYYLDLRSDLSNTINPYYEKAEKCDKANPDECNHQSYRSSVPANWNRINDTASWQHLTIFNLGFEDGFKTWQSAYIYNENYADLSSNGKNLASLEGYLRAVESGDIHALNAPVYDWGRGIYGPNNNTYFYKDAGGQKQSVNLTEVVGKTNALAEMDFAKAGMISRGGAYVISDYDSIKKIIANIANRIEKAMASGITGAALGGSGRVTASSEASGSVSTLLTTYLNEETLSGNIFAFKNCPLIAPTIIDENGRSVPNPAWKKNECGSRLWNAATALNNGASSIGQKTITNIIAADSADDQSAARPEGALFSWANIAKDKELKAQLSGGNDELGEARVNWVNGTLYSELPAAVRGQFRKRANIEIPIEGQRYKKDENGDLVKDDQGNYVKADPINIPNRIGEIVYAVPKSVDNVGTLNTTHPLYDEKYSKFVENTVKKRQPLVLAGANDGHLYAFTNPANRSYSELAFSYIPRAVIADGRLTTMTQSSTSAESKPPSLVNGPFTVRDAQVDGKWGTYVVGTLGAGGNTVYALDISTGRADTSMFKWEVNLGQGEIMSEPRIVWLRKPCPIGSAECKVDGKWVVLLASGYNAKDVSLVVLDLKDGSELARIRTGAQYTAKEDAGNDKSVRTCTLNPLPDDASDALKAIHNNLDKEIKVPASVTCDNGLGALTVFDADNDSGADFVFAGDLLGNVWKFDLTGFFNASGSQSTDLNKALKVAYNSPLFVATTSSDELIMPDTRQPITAMIELDDGAYGEGSMLYFGTGRLFNQNERNIPQPESLYGIWDIPRYTEQGVASFKLPLRRNGGSNYDLLRYRFVTIDSKDVVDPNSALKKFKELRTMIRIDNLETTDYLSFDLKGRNVNAAAKAVGWVADFPEAVNKSQGAERVVERARTFDGNVYFATFTPDEGKTPAEGCNPEKGGAGGKGRFYMMDRMTGGPLKTSPFDFNGDGKQDSKDGIKISKNGLGNGADNYTVDKDNNVNISVSGLMTGNGSSSILSIEGVKKRAEMAKMANCDYTRQIVFPATVDPNTGNPLVLTSCNINRYRVWKQPVID